MKILRFLRFCVKELTNPCLLRKLTLRAVYPYKFQRGCLKFQARYEGEVCVNDTLWEKWRSLTSWTGSSFSKRLTLCKFACIETTDRCGFVLQIFHSENLLASGCGVLVRQEVMVERRESCVTHSSRWRCIYWFYHIE